MDWPKTINWIALFLAFLGPVMVPPASMGGMVTLMFILGVVVAILTYNSGFNTSALTMLLLAALALVALPQGAGAGIDSVIGYMMNVIYLTAWYAMPIALAQGWKGLVS